MIRFFRNCIVVAVACLFGSFHLSVWFGCDFMFCSLCFHSFSAVPPMMMIQNQLVGAPIGQNVTLECTSEAFPKSINFWMRASSKNDSIITSGKFLTYSHSILLFVSAKWIHLSRCGFDPSFNCFNADSNSAPFFDPFTRRTTISREDEKNSWTIEKLTFQVWNPIQHGKNVANRLNRNFKRSKTQF